MFELVGDWFGGWKHGLVRRIESVGVVLLVDVKVFDVLLVDTEVVELFVRLSGLRGEGLV